jgi:hypothetical protein
MYAYMSLQASLYDLLKSYYRKTILRPTIFKISERSDSCLNISFNVQGFKPRCSKNRIFFLREQAFKRKFPIMTFVVLHLLHNNTTQVSGAQKSKFNLIYLFHQNLCAWASYTRTIKTLLSTIKFSSCQYLSIPKQYCLNCETNTIYHLQTYLQSSNHLQKAINHL